MLQKLKSRFVVFISPKKLTNATPIMLMWSVWIITGLLLIFWIMRL